MLSLVFGQVQSQSLGIKVNSELNQRPPQTKQELFNGREKEYKPPAQNQPYPIEKKLRSKIQQLLKLTNRNYIKWSGCSNYYRVCANRMRMDCSMPMLHYTVFFPGILLTLFAQVQLHQNSEQELMKIFTLLR